MKTASFKCQTFFISKLIRIDYFIGGNFYLSEFLSNFYLSLVSLCFNCLFNFFNIHDKKEFLPQT